jgi:hypothetical protein
MAPQELGLAAAGVVLFQTHAAAASDLLEHYDYFVKVSGIFTVIAYYHGDAGDSTGLASLRASVVWLDTAWLLTNSRTGLAQNGKKRIARQWYATSGHLLSGLRGPLTGMSLTDGR